jgi:dTDP-glucose pyrophosphorylase
MQELNQYQIAKDASIRAAIKKMDKGGIGMIVCVDEGGVVIGVVTDGDFRRAILRGVSLEERIEQIVNAEFHSLAPKYDKQEVVQIFKKTGGKPIPVLKNGKLIDIITEEGFFKIKSAVSKRAKALNVPVVIMAGGKGTRLDPFTRVLPKPLIPIGEKPIIEIIMERFAEYGMTKFYISVNHKKKMLKAFFEDYHENYTIDFIEENEPLGTAGALKFLQGRIATPFFVTNCDIIIDSNYRDIYDFHHEQGYDLTLVASMQHHKIPYGVCEIENEGNLKSLTEKPEYDFLANTGFYLLNPEVFEYIPQAQQFDMTDLIAKLKAARKKVGVYPISEKAWIDVGQWEEYKKSIGRIELI